MNSSSSCFKPVNSLDLAPSDFKKVCKLVYRTCGIDLKAGKEDLVKSRLARRLRALNQSSYSEYIHFVESDHTGKELAELVDVITTNKTHFFRDTEQFGYISNFLVPRFKRMREPVRIWCAGCSYGQEPYSIAMLLKEHLPFDGALKILATDISRPALQKAGSGIYTETEVSNIPRSMLLKYFHCNLDNGNRQFRIKDRIRDDLHFARLNLINKWPMKGPFHLILCRNVMIYFDKPTRQHLINRFWELLAPRGSLLLGLSESLTGLEHDFEYVQPATYFKSD